MKHIKVQSILFLSLLFFSSNSQASEINAFLKEHKNDYPECVKVVRNQLFILPEETRIAMLPYLFETCKSGREIGEKKAKKTFRLPKKNETPQ